MSLSFCLSKERYIEIVPKNHPPKPCQENPKALKGLTLIYQGINQQNGFTCWKKGLTLIYQGVKV